MTEFFETEEKVTESQIHELEIKLGFKFPQEYKNHLLEFNGGRCDPNNFSFVENGVTTESSVEWFLALYDGEYDNLEDEFKNLKIEEKRMPDTFFPIANDPLGNCICMNSSDGGVYFWDHEREINYSQSNDNDRSNLYLIANSLKEFLSGLR